MIQDYTRPQTEISQRLETTANPLLDRIHAVVVGPAYIHADADADNLVFEGYQENSEITYKLLRNGAAVTKGTEVVEQDTVSLTARNLRLSLFTDKVGFEPLSSDTSGRVIKYTGDAEGFLNTGDPDIATAFDGGRPPTPGDLYSLSANGYTTIERRVIALLGQDVAASQGATSYSGAAAWANSAASELATIASTNLVDVDILLTTPSASALRYVRRNGVPGLGVNGGLRLRIVMTCTAGGVSPTFSVTVNGAVAAFTINAPGGGAFVGADAKITLGSGGLIFTTDGVTSWNTGDRITFDADYEIASDPAIFDDTFTLTGYTYENATRRLASAVIIEVLTISDADVLSVRISDTSGLMTPVTRSMTTAGGTFTIDYDGGQIDIVKPSTVGVDFHVGQRYAISIVPPSRSTTIFDKVQLNAPIGTIGGAGAALRVSSYLPYNGPIPALEPVMSATNYVVGANSVTLSQLSTEVAGYTDPTTRTAVDGYGTVAVIWRAAISAGVNEGLVPIDSLADITANFYSALMGSELGYGLAKAFGGSQGKRVYALNTGGKELADFEAAFAKLEAANQIYTIAVLTEDEEVMKLASSHANAMSASTVKRFRRCYVGTDSPGEYPILALQDDGSAYTASIQAGEGGGFTLAVFDQAVDLSLLTITRGDKLLLSGTGQTYLIDEVQSVSLPGGIETLGLVLQSGPNSPVSATACQIIAADTPENTARFVWERSGRIGQNSEEDRRIANIWQDGGKLNNVTIPNRFGACEAAGIRTALQPQQGLTRTEVSFIDSAPAMYTKFRPTLLDQMAARGVWIIAQNSADTPCYVRHQLTTAVSNGSLYYEDNAGTNVDTVCFALDDITDPKIGKRNATPRTVAELKNLTVDLLNDLTQDDYDSEIGPQLVAFFNSQEVQGTIDATINATFKDRIDEAMILEVPLPLNTVKIVVSARTIKNDGVVATALSTTTIP